MSLYQACVLFLVFGALGAVWFVVWWQDKNLSPEDREQPLMPPQDEPAAGEYSQEERQVA